VCGDWLKSTEAQTSHAGEGFVRREDAVMIVPGSTLEAPGRTSNLEVLRVEDILYHASRRD